MQIVINIDDEDYDDITLTGENTINLGVLLNLREAVRKGTPLPKGHGDLIDRKLALSDDGLCEFHMYSDYAKMRNYLKSIPTIIEADRSE